MDKLKKDFIVIYLARNALATLMITIVSFVYDLTNYYGMLPIRAFAKIFTDSFYTVTYFMLLWILNYLLFEIYKMIVDMLKDGKKQHAAIVIKDKRITYGSIIPLTSLIILLVIDFNQLFKVNFILLSLFMFLRSVKEEIKQRKK